MANVIRLATRKDAPQIIEIYSPFCTQTAVSFETAAPSEQDMVERILSITERYPWLVCEYDGRIRGYAYASRHRERAAYRWSVDVATYVHPSSRRQGVGTTLCLVLFDLLRQQGIFKAYAGVTLPNPSSIEMQQRLGFRSVGTYHGVGYKLGYWHDVSWWELSLQAETANPPEPKPLSAFLNTDGWANAIEAGERRLNRKDD